MARHSPRWCAAHRPASIPHAEKRSRDLATGVQCPSGNDDLLVIACDALANISLIAGKGWGSDKELDDALRRINEAAPGAWSQLQGRGA
ncbi:hypothetical protein WDZ92_28335 [Nostoc sp. NIES-2111]